jgi:hypothetical protein
MMFLRLGHSLSSGARRQRSVLELFDTIVKRLRVFQSVIHYRRQSLAVLAGYLATVGGWRISEFELGRGHIPGLARNYGLGLLPLVVSAKTFVWTSSFDGLARLVARELMRPFRLDEAPACDFLRRRPRLVLADSMLSDPLFTWRLSSLALRPLPLFLE